MAADTDILEPTAPATTQASVGLRDYIDLLRPAQWVKNVVVFAGPAAGMKLLSVNSAVQALLAFAAFCLAASGTYCINDALDRKADSSHPTKKNRPVARGVIQPATAMAIGGALFVLAMLIAGGLLNRWVAAVVAAYFVMSLAYSVTLKRRMILDVIIIATGFVLRAWAGALAVGVGTSEWMVACMFTLCLFLGFGKRRCEIAMIGDADEAGQHRRTLIRYTPALLTHLITVSAGIAVVTFLLYTLDVTRSPAPFQKDHLFYTLPLVVYGIFRFAMVTELGVYSGPTEIVFRDKALLGTIILWAVIALVIVYQTTLFGPNGIPGLFGGL